MANSTGVRIVPAVFVIACVVTATPVPASPRPADALVASPGVEHLANIPDAGAVGGGIRTVGDRRYLITTGVSGVRVYDVTEPATPVLRTTLPLPHYENEEVAMSDDILLIASDPAFVGRSLGGLIVIDLSDLPELSFAYVNDQTGNRFRDPPFHGGHTVSCVRRDCSYAYATGPGGYASSIYVFDLRDPSQPAMIGVLNSPVGGVHDATLEADGLVWVVGEAGMAALDVEDVADPVVRAASNPFVLDYVHNLTRRGDVLLVTEESYVAPQCSKQGRFATATVTGGRIRVLDTWTPELGGATWPAPAVLSGDAAGTAVCSAHWFDERDGTVAIAWYQQGLRLLDVTDPSDIRSRGWFIPPGGVAFDALWATDDIVYVFDNARGLDVIRVGEPPADGLVVPPPPATRGGIAPEPHPLFGYACSIVGGERRT